MRELEPFAVERQAILERLEAARLADDAQAVAQCIRELDALAMNQQAVIRVRLRKARHKTTDATASVQSPRLGQDGFDLREWLAREYAEISRGQP